jgi:hypothetical protein
MAGQRRPPYPPFFDQLAKLPPEERRKAQEADPRFQRMSPEQQERARRHLEEFVNLSEQQKTAVREQWAAMKDMPRNEGPGGPRPQFRGGPGQPGTGPQHNAEGMGGPGPRRPPFPPFFEQLAKLPPEDRRKALEADQHFQRMPAEQQVKIRQSLESFANMSEEQRATIRNRWAIMNERTPEEQQRIRENFRRWNQIPEERRPALHQEMHVLRGLTPAERDKRFATPEFQKNFSPVEQSMLKDMSGMVPPPRRDFQKK